MISSADQCAAASAAEAEARGGGSEIGERERERSRVAAASLRSPPFKSTKSRRNADREKDLDTERAAAATRHVQQYRYRAAHSAGRMRDEDGSLCPSRVLLFGCGFCRTTCTQAREYPTYLPPRMHV